MWIERKLLGQRFVSAECALTVGYCAREIRNKKGPVERKWEYEERGKVLVRVKSRSMNVFEIRSVQ